MLLEVWSAGDKGKLGKSFKIMGYIIVILWVCAIASCMYAVWRDSASLVQTAGGTLFFIMVSFFLPLIGVGIISSSKKSIARNTKFTMELIPMNVFKNTDDTKDSIVFADKTGVVLSNNKQAYEDWSFFYTLNDFSDFIYLYNTSKN